ncbi:GNAT family N-acetyltransferase [Paenibacillus pasadenensis]|uniref:Acetyltransferase AcuA, acetyl-CoA synthetase inhibitor n=1 Tax=Paenibacillus pasadenensis TaxID=217090 RepID=A0A2N5N7P7_9BACL|nr:MULTISPECIES: GNAT family N-acetyltransferase [Paenibacillus]PLT46371.1 Acetyltransferase AcuA, acetyl-CoA synthetase inhibitor [Paenibacillus pasadenensis]QGG56806.1 N-acetyltransferase [Paenibacillus sp. B01]
MEPIKRHHSLVVPFGNRELVLEGPVDPSRLADCTMHPGLDAFRRPKDQLEALIEIAGLEEGRIIITRDGDMIVGYVTFHYPDELERWSEGGMDDLIELGAVEVAKDYRSVGLGKKMIALAFEDGQLENFIVYTTEYYWHWDLEGTGLGIWDYRRMMEKLMKSVGMVWFATDDPEICSHPANCLMVRIGKQVPLSSVEQFDRVRFRQRFMY